LEKYVTIKQTEAELLYAGLIVDMKNFTFKTGVRTLEAAACLRRGVGYYTCQTFAST
jgi:c-di-AMP phosphodiesterase-like protein